MGESFKKVSIFLFLFGGSPSNDIWRWVRFFVIFYLKLYTENDWKISQHWLLIFEEIAAFKKVVLGCKKLYFITWAVPSIKSVGPAVSVSEKISSSTLKTAFRENRFRYWEPICMLGDILTNTLISPTIFSNICTCVIYAK